MFAMIQRAGAGVLLATAVALSSGCVASPADEVSTQGTQQALSQEKVIVDLEGRRWKNNGKVTYAKKRFEDLKREVEASAQLDAPGLSLANLEDLSDDEAVQLMRPRMEFNNTEFLMEDADARELVGVLRKLKKERLKRTERGITLGEDGHIEDSGAPEGVGGVSQGLIINGDQRSNNNYRADEYPYSIVAQGGTKATSKVEADPWCTCFKMINDHTCITAGHCHWWKGAWQERRPLTFQAGSSSPRTVLPAGCYNRVTWYSGGDDHSYDIAVLALRGRNDAWCPSSGYTGHWFGWNEPVSGNMDTWTVGYPAEPPFGWSYPTQTWQASALTSNAEVGWYLAYTHDMTGGQSGAPVVTTWSSGGYRVRGSHWGAPFSGSNRNYGIAMWSEIVDLLKSGAGY